MPTRTYTACAPSCPAPCPAPHVVVAACALCHPCCTWQRQLPHCCCSSRCCRLAGELAPRVREQHHPPAQQRQQLTQPAPLGLVRATTATTRTWLDEVCASKPPAPPQAWVGHGTTHSLPQPRRAMAAARSPLRQAAWRAAKRPWRTTSNRAAHQQAAASSWAPCRRGPWAYYQWCSLRVRPASSAVAPQTRKQEGLK